MGKSKRKKQKKPKKQKGGSDNCYSTKFADDGFKAMEGKYYDYNNEIFPSSILFINGT